MRRLFVIPLALLIAAGCQDNPVQPRTMDAPDPALAAAQGDRSEWENIFSLDFSGWYDVMPCINDGAGGWGTFYTVYNVLEKEVITPSGNVNRVQKVVYTSPDPSLHAFPWFEADSGEIWWMTKMVQPGHLNTQRSDGMTYGVWQDTEIWENASGDRIMLRGHFKYVFYDYGGPIDVIAGPDVVLEYDFTSKCLGS